MDDKQMILMLGDMGIAATENAKEDLEKLWLLVHLKNFFLPIVTGRLPTLCYVKNQETASAMAQARKRYGERSVVILGSLRNESFAACSFQTAIFLMNAVPGKFQLMDEKRVLQVMEECSGR